MLAQIKKTVIINLEVEDQDHLNDMLRQVQVFEKKNADVIENVIDSFDIVWEARLVGQTPPESKL